MAGPTPFTAALDLQRASIERATDLLEKTAIADERAETIAAAEVGTTPSEVVYEENKLELHRYDPTTVGVDPVDQRDVPILVVYALINRPYILDLQPDRSVVRTLLEEGFEVYLIDWGEPSTLDASLTLSDYVERYIDNCMDVVRERSEHSAVHLLGYCMGGTMSAMYAALFPEKVRTLSLMAAGLCFEQSGGVLELWGDEEYFNPDAVVETFGNVPSEFLDIGFALMDPVDNLVGKYARLFDNLDDEEFVENFARMEQWIGDGIDVAGPTYQQFISDIYQGNKLYRNELSLDGTVVDIDNLTMPVLQIVGEYDHLIPPAASTPFNERIPSEDTEIMRMRSGHIGLSVSSSSHEELWPKVCEWLAERSQEPGEETADASTTDSESTAVIAERLTDISGIGETYAERLQAADVTSVDALAEADPAILADEIDVGEKRVRDWVSQADGLAE